MGDIDRYVQGMVLIRLISSAIELSAALYMLRLNQVEAALRVNAALGLVGPLVLLAATTVGVLGLAGRTSPWKIGLAFLGVLLILRATR